MKERLGEQVTDSAPDQINETYAFLDRKIQECREYFDDEHERYTISSYIRRSLTKVIMPKLSVDSNESALAQLIIEATKRTIAKYFQLGNLDIFETSLRTLQAGKVDDQQLAILRQQLAGIDDRLYGPPPVSGISVVI